tara:strand:+ start:1073 stop:1906 length:834 start_codon:yes stop_codon:yes gene_type:complete
MSSKAIIIAVLERYSQLLLDNINNLYNNLGFTLPMELWQIGNEISETTKEKILKLNKTLNKITFKNVEDYSERPDHYKGWQIKAFMLMHTDYNEVIICDCDVVFGVNPEIIFDDDNYKKTGTFFFRDFENHRPNNLNEIIERSMFVKKYIPVKTKLFPLEWDFVYSNTYNPKHNRWFYQESGCVFINKTNNLETVKTIYNLNNNWKETYKYIYGDKETFWLSFVINDKEYYINDIPGINMKTDMTRVHLDEKKYNNFILTHIYQNKYFFSQKGYPNI